MNEGPKGWEGEPSPQIESPNVGEPSYESMSRDELIKLAKQQGEKIIEQSDKIEELLEKTGRDHLTGLRNRDFFVQKLEALERHPDHREKHTSILMIDLDRFKKINDDHGHAIGDLALQKASLAISNTVRATDVVARIGGEEIAVILFGSDRLSAGQIAEEIRTSIEGIVFDGLPDLNVTASIGVAELQNGWGYNQIVHNADLAMYDAKTEGRNRVVLADLMHTADDEPYLSNFEIRAEEK